MKKYMFLYYGFGEPTPEVMSAWGAWFKSVGDSFVDSGNPFGASKELTKTGSVTLSEDSPLTGYSIVNAENMEAAEKLLEGCPFIDKVRIYEAVSM